MYKYTIKILNMVGSLSIISICSGGYSNSETRGKDFQKLMFSKKEKEL